MNGHLEFRRAFVNLDLQGNDISVSDLKVCPYVVFGLQVLLVSWNCTIAS